MPMVGIPLEILYTMLVIAFAAPVFFIGAIYLLWVPRPSKAYIKAKALKQHVDIDANDMGILDFNVGKIQGPGMFTNKKEFTTFIPRVPESWVNKTFSADGIRTLLSYGGKAISVSHETLAVLELNKMFAAEKSKPENKDKKEEELYRAFMIEHPEAQKLLSGLGEAKAVEEQGKGNKKTFLRKVAIILDPRIIKNYISKNAGGAQLKYYGKIKYNQGVAETESPTTKFKGIFIIIIIVMAVVGLALLFLSMNTGSAPVKLPGT